MTTSPDELRTQWMSRVRPCDTLNLDPIRQFESWYTQAIDSGIAEPNAMSLATTDADCQPWVRTVLLKFYDACRREYLEPLHKILDDHAEE